MRPTDGTADTCAWRASAVCSPSLPTVGCTPQGRPGRTASVNGRKTRGEREHRQAVESRRSLGAARQAGERQPQNRRERHAHQQLRYHHPPNFPSNAFTFAQQVAEVETLPAELSSREAAPTAQARLLLFVRFGSIDLQDTQQDREPADATEECESWICRRFACSKMMRSGGSEAERPFPFPRTRSGG